jgi:hypothetical protein
MCYLEFLTKTENKNINKFWKFIDCFYKDVIRELKVSENRFTITNTNTNTNSSNKKNMFSVDVYRKYIIQKIREKYTPVQFYFYEKILHKILWYLITLFEINIEKIIKVIKINKIEDKDINSRSYINKEYIYNEDEKCYYYSDFRNNYNDKIKKIIHIILDKNLFYEIIESPNKFKKIKITKYDTKYELYYRYDYPFPNITLLFINNNSKKTWINRIKKMYYHTNTKTDIDKYWYKIIK